MESCNTYIQRYKVTIMRYFTDKMGMVGLSEFMIDHDFENTEIR